MKKIWLIFCMICVLIFAVSCTQVPQEELEETVGETYEDFVYDTIIVDEKSYITILEYNGTEEVLLVPSDINGTLVGSINSLECKHPEKIKKIILPESIMMAGRQPLEKLPNLTEIEVAEGNSCYYSIDGVLFQKFEKKDFLICYPAGKKDEVYTIPEGTDDAYLCDNHTIRTLILEGDMESCEFFYGSDFETVVINDKVQYIREGSFENCKSLKRVEMADNVELIEGLAFANCSSLSDVKLSSGLERILSAAFSNCESLKMIEIPERVYYINEDAFDGCPAVLKKEDYLEKLEDGSYGPIVRIKEAGYWENAANIEKICPLKDTYLLQKGEMEKLETEIYIGSTVERKGIVSTTSILKYISSNPKIVQISPNGTMKALTEGETTIKVKLRCGVMGSNAQTSYEVTVKVE